MDYKKISLISLGHMSTDINAHALPALLPYLAAAHDFDYQTCGLLAFAYAAVASLVQPVLGLIADKVAKGWFIPLGILLAGVGFSLSGWFSSAFTIFLALMAAGIGAAIFHPEGARYANIVSGSKKGMGLSIFAVGGSGAMVIGPLLVMLAVVGLPVGGFTLGGFGLHGTTVFGIIGVLMSALLFWRINAWNIDSSRAAKKAAESGRNDWNAFAVLMGCMLTRTSVGVAFGTYLPLYWERVFQQSAEVGNMVLIFYSLFGVASNLMGGECGDRWGFRRVARATAMLTLPCVAVFPFVTDPWLAALLLVPIAVGIFAPYSSLVVLGQRYLSRNVAFASGMTLGVAISVGGMFAPVLGWAADLWGGLAPAMHLLTPLAAVCVLFACMLREPAAE